MPKEEAKALENVGYIFYDRFKLDSAQTYFEKALEIDEKIANTRGQANKLNAIGQVFYQRQDFRKALDYYAKGLQLLDPKSDETVKASIYNNISLAYRGLGNFPKAIETLLLALDINDRTGVKRKKALNLANLGYCYQEIKELPKALNALQQSLTIAKEINNVQVQNLALVNLGLVYKIMGDKGDTLQYGLAWKCLTESSQLSISLGDKDQEAIALQNLATLALSRKKLDLSEKLIHQSIKLKQEIGKVQTLGYAYIHLAELARKRGQTKRALAYAKTAIINAESYDEITAKRKALGLYAELQAESKHYNEAYKALVQHRQVADSLLNEEKVKAIANAEASYHTMEKQRQIEALENEKRLQDEREKYLYIISFLALAGVTLLVLLLRKKLYVKGQENYVQQLQLQNAALEKEHLKNQLESYTLKLIKSNEAVVKLQEELKLITRYEAPEEEPGNFNFAELKVLRDEDWEHFKKLFESVYPTFLRTLKAKHANLSANDIRLATLFRLELNTREMASVLGIEMDSVKKARHRLRKKLSDEIEMDLREYFLTFS